MATSPKIQCRIISFRKIQKCIKYSKIFCWCWWPFLCLQKDWNSPQNTLVTSLIFILIFNQMDRSTMNSNIRLNFFSNKFDIGIFYVFNIRIIIDTFKILFIRNNLFSLKFVILFFWNFLHFSLNLDYFFHPPPPPQELPN